MALCVSAAAAPASLPPALDAYLKTTVRLNATERKTLVGGGPVTKLLDADPSKEVAVFGAVWIAASPSLYVARLQDIEHFERGGGFKLTKRISDPPRLDDFASLTLSADDIDDLKSCRVGDCELKLSAQAVQRFRREIDWSRPSARGDAQALFRRLALDYVTGYLEGGNARLAVYRDAERPTFVGDELRSLIERIPTLAAAPDLRQYLLEYPAVTLPDSTSFLYWQETEFGLKPTVRINHLVIQERVDATIVASKMLYASHYFWMALELRVLLPDPDRGPGFWFVMVNRSRSDGLSGFVGRLIRGRVRAEALKGTAAALTATRASLEAP